MPLNESGNVIGNNFNISAQLKDTVKGYFNVIGDNVTIGEGTTIGNHCVIEDDVTIGQDCTVADFVLLKKGTIIGDNCLVDSYFRSSGDNVIGNNVTLRFGATIARKVYIEDNVFISPNVMTVYSLPDGSRSAGTYIKAGAFIGTAAVLAPNITIESGVVIGSNSFVNKSISEAGIYAGNPVKLIRKK